MNKNRTQNKIMFLMLKDLHFYFNHFKFKFLNNTGGYLYIPMLLILMLLMICSTATADIKFDKDDKKPWHISADKMGYDQKKDQYTGKGNVLITKKGRRIVADYVQFNNSTKKMLATGDVLLKVGGDELTGRRLEFDLNTETGTLHNGTIFLKENHFYIKGDRIEKTGEQTYVAHKARITTCDGDKPAWTITGRDATVTMEGYAHVKHAAFWARKMPLFYSPYMVVPVKQERQSGLLAPDLGYSSRNGYEYTQPLYWVLGDSADTTLYWQHIEERGEKVGLEFRYVADEYSKGTMMFDYLDDDKIDDGSPESTNDWGYDYDTYPRTNNQRYWFRMKNDQELPLGFNSKVDIDIVSDQDYLYEFRGGMMGYKESDVYFYKNFGRDLEDYDDTTRTNSLQISQSWSGYNLSGSALWNDNIIEREHLAEGELEDTLQRLPYIDFYGTKKQFLNSSFYWGIESGYNYFYRKEGTKGHRLDIYPRVYLPLAARHYFTIEPSIGLRETAWSIDNYTEDEEAEGKDKTNTRELYDAKLEINSEIYRVFDINGKNIERIKHLIQPKIKYNYLPEEDQDDLPYFTPIDRIDKRNLITYSLTNILVSKSERSKQKRSKKKRNAKVREDILFEKIVDAENIEEIKEEREVDAEDTKDETKDTLKDDLKDKSEYEEDEIDYKYRQIFRFLLRQSYDIDNDDDEDLTDTEGEDEPFSPIYGEIQILPHRHFALEADAKWDIYENEMLTRNAAMTLSDKRGDRLFVEYRYSIDLRESFYSNLILSVTDKFLLYGEYEENIEEKENIRNGIGMLYTSQCWSIDINYSEVESERKVGFKINLFGIGGFGQTFGVGGERDTGTY